MGELSYAFKYALQLFPIPPAYHTGKFFLCVHNLKFRTTKIAKKPQISENLRKINHVSAHPFLSFRGTRNDKIANTMIIVNL